MTGCVWILARTRICANVYYAATVGVANRAVQCQIWKSITKSSEAIGEKIQSRT